MFNRHILLFLITISILFASCKQPKYVNQDVLKSITAKVDKIQIFYYRKTDTLNAFVTDKERIHLICNLIDGKVDDTLKQCSPSGHILFYSKDNIIFESLFTIGNDCEQLSYFLSPQHYDAKLTYRAGMFLSEFGQSFK